MANPYDQLPSTQLVITPSFSPSFATDFVLALALRRASLQNVSWLKGKPLSIWLVFGEKTHHSFTVFTPE